MNSSIAVIIPALNEEGSLASVLKDLPNRANKIVVDNGSEDRTAEIAREHGATVIFEPRKGYGSAILAGMQFLENAPPDVVVILDADNADRADLIGFLTEPIFANHADLVLSDRTRHADVGALTPPQRFGNWLACRLMRLSTGHHYNDMGPFRAIRWDSLVSLDMCDPTWGWNVEMQMKAIQRGLRVLEIPMPYRRRTEGFSKISGDLKGAAKAGARILWAVHHYSKS